VLDVIWAEIDTQDHLTMLFAQVEDCIRFLVTIGGTAVKEVEGTQKLEAYVLDTLLLEPEYWKTVTTATISQVVELRHLRCLMASLEEKMQGDPLERVDLRYRDPLPPALEQLLRSAAPRMDLSIIVGEIRGLLLEQLTKGSWPGESSLKQYLVFSSAVDLEETEWYVDHFPDDLHLAHALSAYKLLAECVSM
jgi:hypothetical protein